MVDWRQSLAGVDEDYLVGISNKGIVKRAYKDIEAAGSEALTAAEGLDWSAPELTVAAGGETVTIRLPLGESRCSCPSRSICRHVVMAVLLARQAAVSGEPAERSTGEAGSGEAAERSAGETGSGESAERSTREAGSGEPAERGIGEAGSGESAEKSAGGAGSRESVEKRAGEAGNREHAEKSTEGTGSGEPAEKRAGEAGSRELAEKSTEGAGSGEPTEKRAGGTGNRGPAEGSTVGAGSRGPAEKSTGGISAGGTMGQRVWQEILAQPRKPLLRALGSRGLRRLVSAMEADHAPQVERGTVVRMKLPGQDMTVKLLSPLEYSTCTCHKKELCSHKAEAILWCQYLEKQLTVQDLTGELEQEPAFELPELRDAAGQVRDCLEHLLETGLARSGTEQAQELERLAVLCHNAGLPGWEGDIRALAEGYEKYLRRAAGQTMEKLAGQMQRLYEKTAELGRLVEEALSDAGKSGRDRAGKETEPDRGAERAFGEEKKSASRPEKSTAARIQALAGEFRSEYLPAGNLELTGITVEHFVTDSGYEGDTVYFLDVEAGTWYTYTSARPTFYEGRRRSAYQEKAPAPWGVPLPLEGLAGVRLRLQGAKCDAGGRLSSTQETRGEILGKSELTAAKLEGWYYRDYGRLFAEQIPGPGEKSGGPSRLAFVQATRFERGHFNEITQKLELPIWDEEERQVLVELPYSKRDEASIRYLERLKKNQQPCFLGRVYLQGSRICLYPVDLLERRELEGADGDVSPENGTGEAPEKADRVAGVRTHDMGACQALQGFLEEVSWLLQEIYQVGSATVQDSTLEALRRTGEQGKVYGMGTLADWLRQLEEQLSGSRHRLRRQPSDSMRIFCRLWQYVQLCRQRTTYDIAGLIYSDR